MSSISEKQLAEIVGITTNRLRQLGSEGAIPAPIKGQYDTGPTLKALFAYYRRRAQSTANDLKAQRTRESTLRGDLLDLDVAERRKNLVPMADVTKLIGEIYVPVRSIILSMPHELGRRCNPTDPRTATEALQKWVDSRFFPQIRAKLPLKLRTAEQQPAEPKPRKRKP